MLKSLFLSASLNTCLQMLTNMSSLSVSSLALESDKKVGCSTDSIMMGFDLLLSATILQQLKTGL